MIVEYIIDKDEYKKKIAALNFIASNGKEVAKRNSKAKGKNNYFLKLSCAGNDKDAAQALSEISSRVEEVFNHNNISFRLLTNEASQFFVKELYPSVCEFETKLRKFIHSTLFDVNAEAQSKVEARIKAAFEKKQIKDKLLKIDFLERGSLEEIIAFLFANDDFYSDIKTFTNANRLGTRQDLLEFIEKCEKHTIWEEFFSKDFGDSILPTVFKDIISCRNDVMHFHNISYERYLECKELLKKGIDDLNKQIKKGIVIEDNPENVLKLSNNSSYLDIIANTLMAFGMVVGSVTDKIIDKLPEFWDIIEKLRTPSYMDTIEKISKMMSNIPQVPSVEIPKLPGINVPDSILELASKIPPAPSLKELGIDDSPISEQDEENSKEKNNVQENEDDNR